VESYRISVDDQVKVDVWGNPELSIGMPVRPDGKITMPLIGDVLAAGKEPEVVAADIKEKLSAYIRNPNVSVILTELRGSEFLSRVRVTGAVEDSISIPYRPGMSVLDAVLEAGGVNEFAAPNRTKLHRRTDSETRVFNIKLEDILEEGDLKTNVKLRPGDVISVPERYF
jgi:polysaccharide export outer membrane protein